MALFIVFHKSSHSFILALSSRRSYTFSSGGNGSKKSDELFPSIITMHADVVKEEIYAVKLDLS
jgi:hypothetical protein